jgi:hypothetical protein
VFESEFPKLSVKLFKVNLSNVLRVLEKVGDFSVTLVLPDEESSTFHPVIHLVQKQTPVNFGLAKLMNVDTKSIERSSQTSHISSVAEMVCPSHVLFFLLAESHTISVLPHRLF